MRELSILLAAILAVAAAPVQAEPAARFADLTYRAIDPPTAGEGRFRNPVLPGFHPDPSIVRVGADFYLVTSTFSWFPGLPVFHSTDLVNWTLIGHAIDRPGMVDLTGKGLVTDGLYAPAIEYHDGLFYILNTCVRCGGNYYVTARDPAGPWSDPIWLEFDGIDPSFVFEDGKVWIVNNDAPAGPELYPGHRALWIQQVDLASGRMVGERHMIVDGGVDLSTRPVWAEGPHIFKKDGWYYLNAAEGGTAEDHSQTIYRSRSITGPYIPGPGNPTLTQRDLPRPRPDRVEATGHADLVELPDGSWWATFLATRPFAGQSTLLGRETFLLPVTWKDGWPAILGPGVPVPLELPRPNLPPGKPAHWSAWKSDFSAARLSAEWLEMRNPAAVQWYALERDAGLLHIVAGSDAASSKAKPHFLGRRMRHPAAEWTGRISFKPEQPFDLAGLMAFASEEHFLVAGIEEGEGGAQVVARYRNGAEGDPNGDLFASQPLPAGLDSIELRLTIIDGSASLAWRPAGRGHWRTLADEFDVERLASVHTGLFTGVTVGPYAYSAR